MTTETQAQANFEMLSQREASDKISVKLGFCDRSPQTLSLASTIVMRTLEEYGHDVEQFHARTGHRVELDCDSFRWTCATAAAPPRCGKLMVKPAKASLRFW